SRDDAECGIVTVSNGITGSRHINKRLRKKQQCCQFMKLLLLVYLMLLVNAASIMDMWEAYDKVFNHLHVPLEEKVLILTTAKFKITLQLCLFDGSKPKNHDELQPRLSNFFKNFDSNGSDDLCYQGGSDQRLHNWYQSLVALDLGFYKVFDRVLVKKHKAELVTQHVRVWSASLRVTANTRQEGCCFGLYNKIQKEDAAGILMLLYIQGYYLVLLIVVVVSAVVLILDTDGQEHGRRLQRYDLQLTMCGDIVKDSNSYLKSRGSIEDFVSFREMITSQLQGKLWLYDEVRTRLCLFCHHQIGEDCWDS
ncbi:hypothetical protein Tco_0273599, partial [Tanacetum coccineum]